MNKYKTPIKLKLVEKRKMQSKIKSIKKTPPKFKKSKLRLVKKMPSNQKYINIPKHSKYNNTIDKALSVLEHYHVTAEITYYAGDNHIGVSYNRDITTTSDNNNNNNLGGVSFELKDGGIIDVENAELNRVREFTKLRGFFLPLAMLLMWQAYPQGISTQSPHKFTIAAASNINDFHLAEYYETLGFKWDGSNLAFVKSVLDACGGIYSMAALKECQRRNGGRDMIDIIHQLGINLDDVIPTLVGPINNILDKCNKLVISKL